MRYKYPISSQEIRDTIDQIYEMQLYILGNSDSSGNIIYSGIYTKIEGSGIAIFASGYSDFEDLNPYIGKINYLTKNVK